MAAQLEGDAAFSQKVFNIAVTPIKAIVQPDCVADDIWWESVTLIVIHSPIPAISGP